MRTSLELASRSLAGISVLFIVIGLMGCSDDGGGAGSGGGAGGGGFTPACVAGGRVGLKKCKTISRFNKNCTSATWRKTCDQGPIPGSRPVRYWQCKCRTIPHPVTKKPIGCDCVV